VDTLKIDGLGRHLDGAYEFDVADLIGIGGPAMLTGHEAHLIKQMSGVRAGELEEALVAGDWDAMLALAAVILARHDKRVTADQLRDLPLSAVVFDFAKRTVEAEDDAGPPPVTADETPSANGGGSSNPTSEHPENDQSPIGLPGSPRSATSDPLTLAS
jgi:hypothetical protein